MRIKTYYTEDEIVNGLYTLGGEFSTDDNMEYIGPYHRYTTTNEIYTESKWNLRLSLRLKPYSKLPEAVKTYKSLKTVPISGFESVTNTTATITTADIAAGYVTRYFCKKRNSDIVIEIDKIQYDKWINQLIDVIMYDAVPVTWKITGPLHDTIENNITVPGVLEYNRKQLLEIQNTIPTIMNYVTDYAEYYIDNEFVIPKDINGLDS
jgi:hypothetical protein